MKDFLDKFLNDDRFKEKPKPGKDMSEIEKEFRLNKNKKASEKIKGSKNTEETKTDPIIEKLKEFKPNFKDIKL
jgi:hypothetical protein